MHTLRSPRRSVIAFLALASLSPAFGQTGSITASPTSISLAPSQFGATAISWTTANCTSAQVWVSVNGQSPSLFGDATSFTGAVAPWIQLGSNYKFLLYGDQTRSRLLDSIDVAGTYSPLTITGDGYVHLYNMPFFGRSVNYYSAFERALINGSDTSYGAGFAELGKWGLSYARFDLTGYWPIRASLFFSNRTDYFRRLDALIASAEKHKVGLVASFFWTHFTFSDLAGERLDQLGVSNSLTRQKMREFTTAIVNRYKSRPIIWAWEFGNEWNLAVDLPNASEWLPPVQPTLGTPTTRDPVRDILTTSLMLAPMQEFADLVYSLDPGRPISTGHATPRPSQWHMDQWQRGLLPIDHVWTADSIAQRKEIIQRHTPSPYDLMSIHVYPPDNDRVSSYAQIAAETGVALYAGEFGTETNTEAAFGPIFSSLEPVPLANIWVYDRPVDVYNTMPNNTRKWMLVRTLGLAGWWPLDAASGTVAIDSATTKNGTLQNGPVWTTGKVAGGLEFDGINDAVVGPVRPYSAVSSNFTIALWANPKASTTLPAQSTGGTAGTSGQRYAVIPEHGAGYGSNRVGAGVSVGTNGVGVFEHSAGYLAPLLVHPTPLTNWTHVAVVYASNRPSLYLNGSLVRTGLQSTKVVHPSSSLGGMSYGWYRGGLDDVRVFNRSLTPGEVRMLNDYGKNWTP
jgi:hypothetical protein